MKKRSLSLLGLALLFILPPTLRAQNEVDYSDPGEISAGSSDIPITFYGNFPIVSGQQASICFFTGYGSSATPLVTSTASPLDPGQIIATVPASTIQQIPAASFSGGVFYATAYPTPNSTDTCVASPGGSTIQVPIQLPALSGTDLSAIPEPNTNLSVPPGPHEIYLQGTDFLRGQIAVTLSGSFGTIPATVSGSTQTSAQVEIPTLPSGTKTVDLNLCNHTASGDFCAPSPISVIVNPLSTPPGSLTATPGSTNPSIPVTLQATFGDATLGLGVPSGLVTFTDGATTLGTAPLKLATGQFVAVPGPNISSEFPAAPIPLVGDFNRDGLQDLMLVGRFGVSLFLASSNNGTFGPDSHIQRDTDYCSTIITGATADFTGDGYPDLALLCNDPSGTGENVVVYINQGDGTFVENFAGSYVFPVAGGDLITAADFNRDNKIDIAVAGPDGNINPDSSPEIGINIFSGDGHGSFTAATAPIPAPLADGSQIAAVDLNNDGYADLVILNGQPGSGLATPIVVFQNNGSGSFPPTPAYQQSFSDGFSTTQFFTQTLPGSQYPNLVAINSGNSNNIDVVLNNQTSVIGFSTTQYIADAPGALNAAMGDFNGDGYPDLAVFDGTNITVLPADHIGQYSSPLASFTTANSDQIQLLGTTDPNADTYADLLLLDRSGNSVSQYITSGTATASLPGLSFSGGTHTVTATTPGTATFGTGTASTGVTSTALSATVSLGVTPPSPVTYSSTNSATFTVTVDVSSAPAATGTVQVYDTTTSQSYGSATLNAAVPESSATIAFGPIPVGTHSLKAIYSGDANYPTSESSLSTYVVKQGVPTVTWTPNPASIPYGTKLVSTQLNAAATSNGIAITGTYTYSAAVGDTLPAGTNHLTVTFKSSDPNFTDAAGSADINVTQARPTIAWAPNPATISYGTKLISTQLNATATFSGNPVDGTFTYSAAVGDTLPAGTNHLTVSFKSSDPNYSDAAGAADITVTQATPTITWTPNPATISYGTKLVSTQLSATATSNGTPVTGSFTYSATVGDTLPAGANHLTATFTSSDPNFANTTGTATINVTPATPTITWIPNPATISYGTKLVGSQFNATATFSGSPVNGSFAYSAAVGDTLPAGANNLTATFTSADPNFANTSGGATINVTQATPTIAWVPTPTPVPFGSKIVSTQLNATATFNGNAISGTFTYSAAVGDALQVGANNLTVLFKPTDATDYANANGAATITVNKGVPVVTWNPTPNPVTFGSKVVTTQLNATASYNGNAIPGTFAYSAAAGDALPTGADTLTVLFTPTDTTDYTTAPGSAIINVGKATPTITWTPTPNPVTFGSKVVITQLNAAATFNGNPLPGGFTYSAAVGDALHIGANNLTANFLPTDTTDFNSAPGAATITVTQATPVITFTPNPSSIPYGTPLSAAQLDATATSNGNAVPGSFLYSSPVNTVLTAGSHDITATFTPADNTTFNGNSAIATVTVTQAVPTIIWTAPAPITAGTPLSTTQLNATATGVGGAALSGTFAYTPAATTILPVGPATLSVVFTPTDANYKSTSASVPLTVNPAITTTTVSAAPNPSQFGQSVTFTVGVSSIYTAAPIAGTVSVYDGGTTLLGTATLPSLTVTTSTLTAGAHSITAVYSGNPNFATSTSSTLTQTVNSATTTISWTQPASVPYGTKLSAAQLNATVATAYAATVPGIFKYTPDIGSIPTAGTQTLSVLFTPTDTTSFKTATTTVTLTVTKVAPTLKWTAPTNITAGTPLSATQLNATATDIAGNPLPGVFTYMPPAGTILGPGPTTLNASFVPTDAVDYTNASTSVPLTVDPAQTTVAVTSATNPSQFGQPVVFTIRVTSPYTASPLTGTLTLLDGKTVLATPTLTNGTATFSTSTLTAGPHTITAAYAGDSNFASATSQTLTQAVNAATTILTWTQPPGISYGTALSATQLNATVATAYATTVPGTFAYTPATGTVLSAGTQTLSVVFTPTDTASFKPITGTVSLAVGKIAPTLTWATPADIVFGTALSATQLNATAAGISGTLPGAFVYAPAAGNIPAAGKQTLSTTFTPTDLTNYTTATTTVPLNVISVGLISLTPNTAVLGDKAKTITITGSGFVSDSVVKVNGVSVLTTFVNATTLTAVIPASSFLTATPVQILVNDPSQGQTTNALTITITAPNTSGTITAPSTFPPTDQPSLSFQLTQTYPVDITGTYTLSFAPLGTLPSDPMITFGTGLTTSFTIPAGSPSTLPVQFQGGSVAGTVTVTLTLSAGGVPVIATGIQPVTIVDAPTIPGINAVDPIARTGNTLTVTIHGYSNTRDVDHIVFHFIPAPGQKLATSDLTISGTPLFSTWFADPANNQYGGTFTYTQTFNLDQDASVVSQVQVNLYNSQGASLTGTAQ